jgi:hypothetical protein
MTIIENKRVITGAANNTHAGTYVATALDPIGSKLEEAFC